MTNRLQPESCSSATQIFDLTCQRSIARDCLKFKCNPRSLLTRGPAIARGKLNRAGSLTNKIIYAVKWTKIMDCLSFKYYQGLLGKFFSLSVKASNTGIKLHYKPTKCARVASYDMET